MRRIFGKKCNLPVLLTLTVAIFCVYNVYQGSPQVSHEPSDNYLVRDFTNRGLQTQVNTGRYDGPLLHFGERISKEGASLARDTPGIDTEKQTANINPKTAHVINEEYAFYADNISLVPLYKSVNGTERYVPYWQRKLAKYGHLDYAHEANATGADDRSHFLAELLQVRIYDDDKARWTIRELKQWIHFMLLAGVDHIFLCDHYKYEIERLDEPLARYINLGLVTYLPWSDIRHPLTAQVRCYQHIIDTYKHRTRWQIAVDMDEYPFSVTDTREGFLVRYLQNVTWKYGHRVSEISMANFIVMGQGDRKRDLVVDRLNRMTPKPANILVKPLYRPDRVRANIHHNHVITGISINADYNDLKMLHYWGARTQDWGPDTPETIAKTVEMNLMRDAWAENIRNSLLVFGEFNAFANHTGP